MTAIRVLLDHAIDYAGLFPPAHLSLREAITNYAGYLGSPERWALGRFVVPVSRLDEFADTAAQALMRGREAWSLAAIGETDPAAELTAVRDFNRKRIGAVVDSFEFRAGSLERFGMMAEQGPCEFHRFAEIGWEEELDGYLAIMRSTLIGIKFRTGGVREEAFPSPDAVIHHLAASVRAGVPFKCTAGLHHPVRGRYRLTYEPDAPIGLMYGYLNLMLAAAVLRLELGADTARAILLEENPAAFRLEAEQIVWRDNSIPSVVLQDMRAEGSLGFGSCSFREPMDELTAVPAA